MNQPKYRFGGTQRLYGSHAVERLTQGHFCVVGIGGVGSWVAEALARTAVGRITLIDLDDICVSNINRQLHAMDTTVGEAKVDAMSQRIQQINPQCTVHVIEDFISADNLTDYISSDMDYVIDAIDSVPAKAALLAYCKRHKIPVITTGGAGGQIDPTHIQVADLSRTIQDPLAAKLRSELRRNYRFSTNPKRRFGIECVFSTEQLRYPQADGSVCYAKQQAVAGTKLDCNSGFGASVAVTASFGMVAASRAINKFLSKPQE